MQVNNIYIIFVLYFLANYIDNTIKYEMFISPSLPCSAYDFKAHIYVIKRPFLLAWLKLND